MSLNPSFELRPGKPVLHSRPWERTKPVTAPCDGVARRAEPQAEGEAGPPVHASTWSRTPPWQATYVQFPLHAVGLRPLADEGESRRPTWSRQSPKGGAWRASVIPPPAPFRSNNLRSLFTMSELIFHRVSDAPVPVLYRPGFVW